MKERRDPPPGRPKTDQPPRGAATREAAERGGTRFTDDYLGYLLGQANHALFKEFDAQVREAGLGSLEWRVLAVLSGESPMAVGQLAHEVLSQQPTVTKLLQRLAHAGLIEPRANVVHCGSPLARFTFTQRTVEAGANGLPTAWRWGAPVTSRTSPLNERIVDCENRPLHDPWVETPRLSSFRRSATTHHPTATDYFAKRYRHPQTKLQVPRSKLQCRMPQLGVWILVFVWSLDPGVWSFYLVNTENIFVRGIIPLRHSSHEWQACGWAAIDTARICWV